MKGKEAVRPLFHNSQGVASPLSGEGESVALEELHQADKGKPYQGIGIAPLECTE